MSKESVRHLVYYDGRNSRQWYFKPSKLMREAGYLNEPLGTDKAAAIRRVQELNAQWDKERIAAQPPPEFNIKAGTVKWLIERFQMDPTWYKARADRTREQIDWAFGQIVALFGDIRVHDVQRKHLRAYYNDVRINGSITKAEKVMKWFHRLLEYAVEIGMIEYNPGARMKIESPQHRSTTWTPDEIEAVIATALVEAVAPSGNRIPARPSVALAVAIAYDTSLPLQDVLALTWKNYDGQDLNVVQLKNRGNRRLCLPLSERTRAMLDGMSRATERVIVNEETALPYPDRFVFGRVFRKVKQRAGITRQVTFHDIRRTMLTELGARGATNVEIASYSGHSVNSPILKVYVQPTRESAVSAFRKRGGGKKKE
ncbi:integrase [Skermanella aerolata]|uniref:tyrosine-type recombinase/integrase n=1 Tax=Skermanella aerolata TaxID=393310 RepID=UPI003D1BEEEB